MGFAASKAMSNLRKFKCVSDDKLKDLKEQKLKKHTFAKMTWAVKAYKDWRIVKLSDPEEYDLRIDVSNLNNVATLDPSNFEFSMCKFLAEVTKVKDGSDYPGKTLYQLIVSIQKYLHQNGKKWKLIESNDFGSLRTVLDNLIKERAKSNIGLTKRQAEMISFKHEDLMWQKGILGEENPSQLCDTVLFLLGVNLGLRAGDEHYNLRCNSEGNPSQISFKRNENGF